MSEFFAFLTDRLSTVNPLKITPVSHLENSRNLYNNLFQRYNIWHGYCMRTNVLFNNLNNSTTHDNNFLVSKYVHDFTVMFYKGLDKNRFRTFCYCK